MRGRARVGVERLFVVVLGGEGGARTKKKDRLRDRHRPETPRPTAQALSEQPLEGQKYSVLGYF